MGEGPINKKIRTMSERRRRPMRAQAMRLREYIGAARDNRDASWVKWACEVPNVIDPINKPA